VGADAVVSAAAAAAAAASTVHCGCVHASIQHNNSSHLPSSLHHGFPALQHTQPRDSPNNSHSKKTKTKTKKKRKRKRKRNKGDEGNLFLHVTPRPDEQGPGSRPPAGADRGATEQRNIMFHDFPFFSSFFFLADDLCVLFSLLVHKSEVVPSQGPDLPVSRSPVSHLHASLFTICIAAGAEPTSFCTLLTQLLVILFILE
jgi:hypothetical protein